MIKYPFDVILNELNVTFSLLNHKSIDRFLDVLIHSKRVFVVGAGRSGLILKTFAMRLMNLGFAVYVVGETTTPSISSDDLLVIASGSGETNTTIMHANIAKRQGAYLFLITINPRSTIGLISDLIVSLQIPLSTSKKISLEKFSIQPMRTLFEQWLLLLFDGVVLKLMDVLSISPESMIMNHTNLE